jgi:t-SNARE complex subunit (syntaxin)
MPGSHVLGRTCFAGGCLHLRRLLSARQGKKKMTIYGLLVLLLVILLIVIIVRAIR